MKSWGGKWLCDESAVLGFGKQRSRTGLYPVFGRCPFPPCLHSPGCPAAMGRAHALILVEHSAPEEKTLWSGREGSHTFPKTISYSLKHFLSKLLDCYFTAFRVTIGGKIKPDCRRKYPTEPAASDKQSQWILNKKTWDITYFISSPLTHAQNTLLTGNSLDKAEIFHCTADGFPVLRRRQAPQILMQREVWLT